MKMKPRNIYDQNDEKDLYTDEPDAGGVDYFTAARRKNRLMNLFWALLVGLVIGGLVYLMIDHTERQRSGTDHIFFGSRYTPGERIISFRTVASRSDMQPHLEIAVDAIHGIPTLDLPEEGGAPLNPVWVKQAAHYLVGADQAESSGQYEKAIDLYNRTLAIFPDIEHVHAAKGMLYMNLNRHDRALESFLLAAEEPHVTAAVINNLGSCHLALDQLEQAEHRFKQALDMDPRLSSARLNLATVYMKTSQPDLASQEFEVYIRRHPNDLKAMQAYGALLLDAQDYRRATQIFMQVQQKAPEIGPVYFNLGEALAHSADKDAAVAVLRRGVLLVDPRVALGWLASERYNPLRDHPSFRELIREISSPE